MDEDIHPPTEEEGVEERINWFIKSQKRSASEATGSSKATWNKFSHEQTEQLLSLTEDMIKSDTVKREIVWERIKNDKRAFLQQKRHDIACWIIIIIII